MSQAFAEAFKSASTLDGIVFKKDLLGVDQRQSYVAALRQLVREQATDVDEATFNKKFKVKVFYMDTDRYRAIVKVSLYGFLAYKAMNLDASYIEDVFELHFKAYAVYHNEAAEVGMRTDLFNAEEAGQQLVLFGKKETAHPEKGTGKGWRIGSRKSDYHFAAYKRRGERAGIECRVKDSPIRRVAKQAAEYQARFEGTDRTAWSHLFAETAAVASARLASDLEKKGLNPHQYIRGFTLTPSVSHQVVGIFSSTDARLDYVDTNTGEIVTEDASMFD